MFRRCEQWALPLTVREAVRIISAMKPAPFAYADPASVEEVLDLLAEHGAEAVVLAGGQSLVPDLNFRRIRPRLVIDLRRVADMSEVVVGAEAVTVGAAAGVLDLAAAHPAAGVGEAVSCIGHPQIRCRSTVGGTVALAEPAAELPAVVVGLDGVVAVRSSGGERLLPAAEWFVGRRATARRASELVTSVRFDVPIGPSRWAEVARRPNDLPIVGLFVAELADGWRVALAGVADTPVRSAACEAALDADPSDLGAAVAALVAELDPPTDALASSAHRRSIAASLLRQLLAPLVLETAA